MSNKILDQNSVHRTCYSAPLLLVSQLRSQTMLVLSEVQDVVGCSRRLEVLMVQANHFEGEKGVVGGGEGEEETLGNDDQSQACDLPIHHCLTLKMFRLHWFHSHSHLNCCCC